MPRRDRSPPHGRSRHVPTAWWPPPSTPIAVEGGLQARSQRGRIGDTWWSQRFIAVLETVGIGSRLQRGKRYARTGQVLSMEVAAGPGEGLGAGVAGQALPGLHRDARADCVRVGRRRGGHGVERRLHGQAPGRGDARGDRGGVRRVVGPAVPGVADGLDSACSCPDWENPCKHIAAVYFLLAEAFDDDPFLIFAWRGRTKDGSSRRSAGPPARVGLRR